MQLISPILYFFPAVEAPDNNTIINIIAVIRIGKAIQIPLAKVSW